jgi:hypothetical protein
MCAQVAGGEAVAHLVEVLWRKGEAISTGTGARNLAGVGADQPGVPAPADRGASRCTWSCPSARPWAPRLRCDRGRQWLWMSVRWVL